MYCLDYIHYMLFIFLLITVSSVHIIICNHTQVHVMYNKDYVNKGEYTHILWKNPPVQTIYISRGIHFNIINRLSSKPMIYGLKQP